jgi:hypothetical protein
MILHVLYAQPIGCLRSVQMFSLPGSMYISILFGAAYGVFYGLILSCLVSVIQVVVREKMITRLTRRPVRSANRSERCYAMPCRQSWDHRC